MTKFRENYVITDDEIKDFWSKTEPGSDDCINWTGRTNHQGYPIFFINSLKKVVQARRIGYQLIVKQPTPGRIMFGCDNPRCINGHHAILTDKQKQSLLQDVIRKNKPHEKSVIIESNGSHEDAIDLGPPDDEPAIKKLIRVRMKNDINRMASEPDLLLFECDKIVIQKSFKDWCADVCLEYAISPQELMVTLFKSNPHPLMDLTPNEQPEDFTPESN